MRPALALGTLVFVASLGGVSAAPPSAHLRVNLAGYLPADRKVAVLFAQKPINGWFTVRSGSSPQTVVRARVPATSAGTWGRFPHHYPLDVSALRAPGEYVVEAAGASAGFTIGPDALREWPGYLLEYLRQQRCGYNPFLDTVCHPFDGGALPLQRGHLGRRHGVGRGRAVQGHGRAPLPRGGRVVCTPDRRDVHDGSGHG